MKRILSVNVAEAKDVQFGSKVVRTSILKEPVSGPVLLRKTGLEGDAMASPVYGGHRRPALYAYPVEHYEYWQEELDHDEYPHGKFGENITTRGLMEEETCAGDIFRMGSATVQAIGFRIPCRNLALTMGDKGMVRKFSQALRPGIFFSVLTEGEIETGAEISLQERPDEEFTIGEMAELYYQESPPRGKIESLLSKTFLPGTIKKDFEKFSI